MLEATTEARQVMAHVRPGKTAKRNRQLRALERLQTEINNIVLIPWRKRRIEKEIKALESRI